MMSDVIKLKQKTDQDIFAEIDGYIKNPPRESRIITITPKVAAYLLEHYNEGNRTRKAAKIKEFADDMVDKQWKLTGDTVKFSDKQRLRDGQNRLAACQRANCPFTTHVVFGIDDMVFPWMDRGKPRDGADALHIQGVANANTVQSVVRWIALFDLNQIKERSSFTPKEILDLYEKMNKQAIQQAIALARKVYSADSTPISLGAALAYIFGQRSEGLRDKFFEAWATGVYPPRFTPLQKCSREIHKIREYSQGRINDVMRAAMWVTAWNFVLVSKKPSIAAFKWRKEDRFPDVRG
jgi:hypothetical protein